MTREQRAANELLAAAEPGIIGDAYSFQKTLGAFHLERIGLRNCVDRIRKESARLYCSSSVLC